MQAISTFQDQDIYFHHALDMKPSSQTMHTHDRYELFMHIRGRGKYMVEGTEYTLEPGSVIIVRPTESHKLYLEPTEPYERIAIEFSGQLFRQIDPDQQLFHAYHDRPLGRLNQYFSWELSDSIPICVSKMTAPNLNLRQRRLSVIINMLEILYEVNLAFRSKVNAIPNNAHRSLASDIVDYVNNHLYENLSLSQLCNTFFISQCHLSQIFKAATGASVAEYISIKRLFEARRRLRLGEPATEVAKLCGFSDYSAFFRAYKKRFSIAPSQEKPIAKPHHRVHR